MRRAIVGVLLLAACGGSGGSSPAVPGGLLQFHACRTSPLTCATLVVPADWSVPDGPTISLSVVRAPARVPSERIGALTFNYGGPGGATLEPLASSYPMQPIVSSTDLTARFDFVMIDWRGVGDSAPALSCYDRTTGPQLAAERFAPLTDADWTALFQLSSEVSAGCSANAANAPLLAHQDTESAARDFDALRAGLGEATLNMWDVSYGTRLGAMYATLFPDRVRAIALDSPVTPAPVFDQLLSGQSASFEIEFGRFFAWCAAATPTACPFQTPDHLATSVAAAYEQLLTNADAAPVVAQGITFDRATINLTASTLMYFPEVDWVPLGQALSPLANGDGSAMAKIFVEDGVAWATDDNEFSSYQNVFLQDMPLPAALATPAGYQQWVESSESAAPHVALQNAAAQAFAVGWPTTPPPQAAIGNAAAPPLLITATRNDPATPYPGAVALQQALANGSYLVTYEGDGHANAGFQSCLGDVTAAFLIDPTTPPATTDCPDVGVDETFAAAAAAKFHIARPRRR
jgi:pimeloyl-ACP methyl ester carboxylesterase